MEKIKTKEEFVVFVNKMIQDHRNGTNKWPHLETESFLEALASWVEDMDGYYQFNRIPVPHDIPWHIFADCLKGGTMYE